MVYGVVYGFGYLDIVWVYLRIKQPIGWLICLTA